MTDFTRARDNMVNGQLLTNGIRHTGLVNAYRRLPREVFVDDAQTTQVYTDEDAMLSGSKRCLLDPLVEARLLQQIIGNDAPIGCALVLGAASLPSVVMLAAFSSTVIVLEPDPDIALKAQRRLTAQEICNIVLIETSYKEGYGRQAPYDVILAPGAMAKVPPIIADQLVEGGTLLCVLRKKPSFPGRASVVRKLDDGTFSTTSIADASTPYLAGFEPAREFVF